MIFNIALGVGTIVGDAAFALFIYPGHSAVILASFAAVMPAVALVAMWSISS